MLAESLRFDLTCRLYYSCSVGLCRFHAIILSRFIGPAICKADCVLDSPTIHPGQFLLVSLIESLLADAHIQLHPTTAVEREQFVIFLKDGLQLVERFGRGVRI
jgi:hypothetical protein